MMGNCCFCKKELNPDEQVILARAKTIVKHNNLLNQEAQIKIWEASSCSEHCMMNWMMKNHFEDMNMVCRMQILEDHEIDENIDNLNLSRMILKYLKGEKKNAI